MRFRVMCFETFLNFNCSPSFFTISVPVVFKYSRESRHFQYRRDRARTENSIKYSIRKERRRTRVYNGNRKYWHAIVFIMAFTRYIEFRIIRQCVRTVKAQCCKNEMYNRIKKKKKYSVRVRTILLRFSIILNNRLFHPHSL